jgi:uncharacterized protein YjiK
MNYLLLLLKLILVLNCSNQAGNKADTSGYNLNNPEKISMPASLLEISGITFNNGKNNMLYAVQDEDGRLYYLKAGDKKALSVKFGKHGDYEDLSIWNDLVIILRSDGTLFSFRLQPGKGDVSDEVTTWKDVIPKGEYEGLYADSKRNELFVLLKKGKDDDFTGGYILSLSANRISQPREFRIHMKALKKMSGIEKLRFHPSALAKNPSTGNWYILSSVNKMLVVADSTWKATKVYMLDPSIYHQPEGIAFDRDNTMYISNEGDKTENGNVLRLRFRASP